MRLLIHCVPFSIIVIACSLSSCSKRDLTPVEQSVDSLIDQSLHLHKAEYIEVMLIDAEGVALANREGHWRKGTGEFCVGSAKKNVICPGQLLFPVLTMAAKNHCGIDFEAKFAVGAKRFDCDDVIDRHIKLDSNGKVVDSLPLYDALYSSVAIMHMCESCFPTIEAIKSVISLYLPGSKIDEKDYLKICQGEGDLSVSKTSMIQFARKYYDVLDGGVGSFCFESVQRISKSKYVQESCLLCTDKYTCLVLFKNTCIPGTHQLANEIVEIQCN